MRKLFTSYGFIVNWVYKCGSLLGFVGEDVDEFRICIDKPTFIDLDHLAHIVSKNQKYKVVEFDLTDPPVIYIMFRVIEKLSPNHQYNVLD